MSGIFRSQTLRSYAIVLSASLFVDPARADFMFFDDKAEWIAVVESQFGSGSIAKIDFTQFEEGEVLLDQLVDFGLEWLGPLATVHKNVAFEDGVGVSGENSLPFSFNGDRFFVGFENVQTPAQQYALLLGYQNMGVAGQFHNPTGSFLGVISNEPFDIAFLSRGFEGKSISVDNIYVQIPAPSALGLFAIGFIAPRRRRR